MNWKLSRKTLMTIQSPAELVMIYESNVLKRNHSGEGKDLAFRHFKGANYLYADGRVTWHPQDKPQNFLLSAPENN